MEARHPHIVELKEMVVEMEVLVDLPLIIILDLVEEVPVDIPVMVVMVVVMVELVLLDQEGEVVEEIPLPQDLLDVEEV